MKRKINTSRFMGLLLATFLTVGLIFAPIANAAYTTYNCDALTGGAARALDLLSVGSLTTGDRAIVANSGEFLYFVYDSTATAAENVSTHPYVVRPDDYSTGGNWEEQETARGISDAFSRSQFTYSDADQITCGAASYLCKDKYCYWISTITTNATGAAGGADWWYLYLDYSAITSGTAITATELIWSTTEPTWNTSYRQWMNGDDRCVFAANTAADNSIFEFFHNEDLVIFADKVMVSEAMNPGTTWTDSTQRIPIFTRKALITTWANYVDVDATLFWRTNGQAGSLGHNVGRIVSTATIVTNNIIVITDSSGMIEFKYASVGNNNVYVYTEGWFFPTGI